MRLEMRIIRGNAAAQATFVLAGALLDDLRVCRIFRRSVRDALVSTADWIAYP